MLQEPLLIDHTVEPKALLSGRMSLRTTFEDPKNPDTIITMEHNLQFSGSVNEEHIEPLMTRREFYELLISETLEWEVRDIQFISVEIL